MFPFPRKYPPERRLSPSKDPSKELIKDLADKYQGIGFSITSQQFPSLWDERIYCHPCPYIGNRVMVGPFQPSIKGENRPFDTSLNAKGGGRVWEAVQNDADPTHVEIATMKGRRLPQFSSQLVFRKPLVPGSKPIPVFPAKRGSNSEASASASKRAKLEALENINAPSLTPNTFPAEVISLDDELTVSTQKAVEPKKKKSALTIASVHPPKAIIPLLTKSGASAKKGKGKGISEQGEESSLDCYTTGYMKAAYTLPNGLSIQEVCCGLSGGDEKAIVRTDTDRFGNRPSFLKGEEGRVDQRQRCVVREEKKCERLREEKQTAEVEQAKRCSALEAELDKLKRDHASLVKDVEDSRSAAVAEAKRAEEAEARASKAETLLNQVDAESECPQLLDVFARFKKDWFEEYFEGLLLSSLRICNQAPAEVTEVAAGGIGEEPAEGVGGGAAKGDAEEIDDEDV
ncbi:hypothetical protein LIER_24186 [Lithospermum erythrorhizon]|uniref:Uncharacterized protein n=1 Tax=Lithospermum erythrorhizon TaxID=34254 RepID=A0AAV3R0G4_LITER